MPDSDIPARLSAALAAAETQAAATYRARRSPACYFRSRSRALDDAVSSLWAHCFSGCPNPDFCLLATGGYGRGEMYPHSDLDLAIVSARELSEDGQARIAQFVQTLWDWGLAPAAKSGSLKQLLAAARTDLAADTAFLEARYLCGSKTLAQQTLTALDTQRSLVPYMESKLLEMQQRHARQPAFALEPDIKNGIGGLRDLHVLGWIARAQGLGGSFAELAGNGILSPEEAGLLRRSHRALACLRIELHLAARREEDRLLFDLQHLIAQNRHPHSGSLKEQVERLMRHYYRTAKTVVRLGGILLPVLRARVYCPLPRSVRPIDGDYSQIGSQIAANDTTIFAKQPEHLFRIVQILQNRRDLDGIAPDTLRAWWAASHNIGQAFRSNPANRARFLGFFQAASGQTRVMRLLNLYGILERYLPEWRKITGLLQHDLYHAYPVDDHILMTLRNMRRLAQEEHSHELPAASALMRAFPKPHILYLAALFHDIAKGRGGDHAVEGAKDAARFAAAHGLPEDEAGLLVWLVREHLTLSLTAQKEDTADPAVIERFCAKVGSRERLDALYLLTVSDIRATNPKIWNGWKARLLETLFQAACDRLSGSLKTDGSLSERRRAAEEHLMQSGHSRQTVRRLFDALGDAYFSRHSSRTAAKQLPLIAAAPDTPRADVRPENGSLRVLAYMPNRDRLFARLCRLFAHHGLDIAAARAFVTAHDYILDNFIVSLPPLRDTPEETARVQAALQHDLDAFVQGDIPELPRAPSRPSRQARLLPIPPAVHIWHEGSGRCTIEIAAANRPGLLADLTEVFAKHSVRLHYAKIATLAERAEDSFTAECPALEHDAGAEFALKRDLIAAAEQA